MWAIGRGLRTVSGETAAGILLGLTVFCFVLGSSSVASLVGPGKKLRWAALLALAVVAAVMALRGGRPRPPRPFAVVAALGAWLAAVAVVSSAWSPDPRLTFGRAASFALLLVTAGALGIAAHARPRLAERLLLGVLGGAVAAAVGGLVMLVAAHDLAVQAAWYDTPARFRGLGQNPDTLAMLEGISAPIALWMLLRSRSARARLLGLGSLLLLLGCISASGSRGGLVAATASGLVLSLALRTGWRRRLALALSVCVAMVGAAAGTTIPKPLPAPPATQQNPGGGPTLPAAGQAVGAPEPEYSGRLQDELFRVGAGTRSLFTSSGRLQTLYEAIREGDARPVVGYGFGTENTVFVDRVYNFQGEYVENSLIGMYLQLGLVGLLSLVALLLAVCVAIALAVRRAAEDEPFPALAAVVAGGLALTLVQSYVYSVGNVATVAFWVAGFVGASGAVALAPRPARVRSRQEGDVVAAA